MDIHIRRLPGSNIDQEFYLVSDVEKELAAVEMKIKKLVDFWEWSRLADKMTFETCHQDAAVTYGDMPRSDDQG